MAEYIDKQAVLADLSKTYDSMAGFHPQFYSGYQFAVNRLRCRPKADVAEVRHGYWKLIGADKQGRGGEWKCMADGCGKLYPYKCNFCPNCGAQMDGGAENARTE